MERLRFCREKVGGRSSVEREGGRGVFYFFKETRLCDFIRIYNCRRREGINLSRMIKLTRYDTILIL